METRCARPLSTSLWRWAEVMSVIDSAPVLADPSGPFATTQGPLGSARSRTLLINVRTEAARRAPAVTAALGWRGRCAPVKAHRANGNGRKALDMRGAPLIQRGHDVRYGSHPRPLHSVQNKIGSDHGSEAYQVFYPTQNSHDCSRDSTRGSATAMEFYDSGRAEEPPHPSRSSTSRDCTSKVSQLLPPVELFCRLL